MPQNDLVLFKGLSLARRLLIFGASVRSAAQSALRAGYRPVCADLFGDADLTEVAEVDVVSSYPNEFIGWSSRIFQDHGRLPIVYTGGLENHAVVVDAIADVHQLAGNHGKSLRTVRDPFRLAECFAAADIRFPHVTTSVRDAAKTKHSWLTKPRKGAAGSGIELWDGSEPEPRAILQEFIDGPSISAVFVGNGREIWLAGVTIQLVGFGSLSASRFAWCGSFGPVRLPSALNRQVYRIGKTLVRQFGLRGLFGVDCIVEGGQAVPIEVNPRYTGSVEVLERASDWRAMETHMAACQDAVLPDSKLLNQSACDQACCGKAVLFADETVQVEDLDMFSDFVSDRPSDGSIVNRRHPVCSVFGQADSCEKCLSVWEANLKRISHRLFSRDVGFGREIRQLWQQYRPYVSVD
jgi:predicted ATP-grasp superfamily ATP-dependent carboligase